MNEKHPKNITILSYNKKRQSFPAIDNLNAASKTFKVEVYES